MSTSRPFRAAHPHRYGAGKGCVYCDAPGSASGEPCAIAEEVERDYTSRVTGDYDPWQHLHVLVGRLKREGAWTLEHVATMDGTPVERFVVRLDGEIVVEVVNVVRHLAARETVARVWRATRR